jgi:hypothetical protein
LPKLWSCGFVLRKLWNCAKKNLNYEVQLNFPEVMGLRCSFAEIYQVLPNLWSYVQFCPNYGVPLLIFTFGIYRYLAFGIFNIWDM